MEHKIIKAAVTAIEALNDLHSVSWDYSKDSPRNEKLASKAWELEEILRSVVKMEYNQDI